MMTHEEIEAAIERLRETEPSDYVGSAVVEVVWAFMGGNTSAMELRDTITAMLEQADPATHMELPVDVDGVPIHVGDEMERGYQHGRVVALMLSNYPKKWNGGRLHWAVQLEGEQAPTALDNRFHHYHKPTVEDVLVDYYKECQLHASKLGLLGLATNEDDERVWRDIATAFVEKLREVMADDDAQ